MKENNYLDLKPDDTQSKDIDIIIKKSTINKKNNTFNNYFHFNFNRINFCYKIFRIIFR